MKRINRDGPRILGGFAQAPRLGEQELLKRVQAGAVVVDTRAADDFAAGHIPGTINIPLNASFTTWAGWLLPYDRAVSLILDDGCRSCAGGAVRDLAMIGLDNIAGVFGSRAIEALRASGHKLGVIARASPAQVANAFERGLVRIIDVRGHAEWQAGHLPGVANVPLGYLAERMDQVPADKPIVLQCQSGARSAIAASLLQARGRHGVTNLVGGIAAWRAAGLAVVQNGSH